MWLSATRTTARYENLGISMPKKTTPTSNGRGFLLSDLGRTILCRHQFDSDFATERAGCFA